MNPDKVILKEDLFFHVLYKKGDIFTIIDSSYRGWDLEHDKTGNKIYECLFIQNIFEHYDIKKDRRDKLNKINEKIY